MMESNTYYVTMLAADTNLLERELKLDMRGRPERPHTKHRSLVARLLACHLPWLPRRRKRVMA